MRRNHIAQFVLVLIAASGLAACSKSPSGPSSLEGVTINGNLVDPGGASASTQSVSGPSAGSAVTVPANLTVSVSGSSITAQVNAAGQFSLLNVPPGNAELRFSAPGMLANVTLLGLENGQTVSLTLSLEGSTVTVHSDRRSNGSQLQLEGKVEALPPTTAALSFMVAGQLVTTDVDTKFFMQGAPALFTDLQVGQRVHVKGQAGATSMLASQVNIQNTHTDVGLNVNGVVSNFTGTASAFEFTVNGTLVKGDANTVFFGNSQFAHLADGQTVTVKGTQNTGFVYATRIHVEIVEIEFTGVIVAPITGTSPDRSFLVDAPTDHTTKTNALTTVRRGSDTQTPAQLQVGMTVEVTGALLPDGTVIAKRIDILGDAVGGLFEMSGNIGGLSGSCATTLSFSVSGYSIVTTATTTFAPSCGAMSNGTKVTVKGTVLAGGSISATSVEKQ